MDRIWAVGMITWCAALALAAAAEHQNQPLSAEAIESATRIRAPEGFAIRAIASEPLFKNPVAFCFDESGRIYVAETGRLHAGVTDNRKHMDWLTDDLACRTVADRVAVYRKRLGNGFAEFEKETDQVRQLVDTDGDGVYDRSTVFASGFRHAADGLAAGLLARRGKVYFACIPDLWLLEDTDGDGRADRTRSLHSGFGVHTSFIGHDLHGLILGPDGRLYFSIGDRGFSVRGPHGLLDYPDTGGVLRCNPDGSDLEVFAIGLRNPQELAFDDFGNLFTGDNNSDSGDKARWVYLVEGGDSGWRIGYQYLERPTPRGPWNGERLWHPFHADQPAYIVPPIANVADGPSGLVHYPGTGLSDDLRGKFLLADFRGAAGLSGIRAIDLRPSGPGFKLQAAEKLFWNVLATDVDFGPDGALYVTDWVEGWNKPNKGRIHRIANPRMARDPIVQEVRALRSQPFERLSNDRLADLLAHADQRVRLEAQWALAERGLDSLVVLLPKARSSLNLLGRIHAIWAIGQLGRRDPSVVAPLADLLSDPEPEIRGQAAKVIGEAHARSIAKQVIKLLDDPSERVQFLATNALGQLGDAGAAESIAGLIDRNANRDPFLRHAGVLALTRLGNESVLRAMSKSSSPPLRLAAVLVRRRQRSADLARFLDDNDPKIVGEAMRAIYDEPVLECLHVLAGKKLSPGCDAWLARRVLGAAWRIGDAASAQTIARTGRDSTQEPAIRAEALDLLARWNEPAALDPWLGRWQPRSAPNDPGAILAAIRGVIEPELALLLRQGPLKIRLAAARLARSLLPLTGAAILAQATLDTQIPAVVRVECLRGVCEQKDSKDRTELIRAALCDQQSAVRAEARRLLARVAPAEAAKLLFAALDQGQLFEQQQAIAALSTLPGADIDAWFETRLAQLESGSAPDPLAVEILEGARQRTAPSLAARLARLDARRKSLPPLDRYRDALVGGDAAAGRAIFFNRIAVGCVKCHRMDRQGGEVGPDLSGIGAKKTREYLLESMVDPNKSIAEGFATVVVADKDGKVYAGILRKETPEALELMTADAKIVRVEKDSIESRGTGKSAMPEDLREQLSPRELRDLVEFLASMR